MLRRNWRMNVSVVCVATDIGNDNNTTHAQTIAGEIPHTKLRDGNANVRIDSLGRLKFY